MGTFALLRVGEFTLNPRHSIEEQRVETLRWRHIVFFSAKGKPLSFENGRLQGSPAEYQITLPGSKADPFRQSVTISVFAPSAVKALSDLVEFSAPNLPHPNDPIFAETDDRTRAVTRDLLILELREVLRKAGHNPNDYNGHSFRKGGAQSLAAAGVRDNVIKVAGRWTSECYQRYIKETRESLREASLAMEPRPL